MTKSNSSSAPSTGALGAVVDLGFRTAFQVAHRMLRAYWGMSKPSTHGALVAIWHDGKLLIVKNSYRLQYTLPGGYLRPTEAAAIAAQRELLEEVRIKVPLDRLKVVYSRTHPFENRQDRVTIVEVEVDKPPRFNVDNREVVWAGLETPEQILQRPIVPHLEEYLREREG